MMTQKHRFERGVLKIEQINKESIALLRGKYKDDIEALEMISDSLKAFQAYHAAIFEAEAYAMLFGYDNTSKEDFQCKTTELDRQRTVFHNTLITMLRMLNRMCEAQSIPPVYGGTVSEERPYRVEIADAALAYVEDVVKNRNK